MKSTEIPEALFLDFDGVLCDSVEVKSDAFAALYQPYGDAVLRAVVDYHRRNGGMSRYDKIRHYESELVGQAADDDRIELIATRFSELVVSRVVAAAEIPGAGALLQAAHGRGVPMHVISGTPTDELRQIVHARRMAQFFSTVDGSPTSKGEHVRRILDTNGYDPGGTVFIGDAIQDQQAAEASALIFFGIVPADRNSPFREGTRLFPNLLPVRECLGL